MSARRQLIVSVAVVALATGAVVFNALLSERPDVTTEENAHAAHGGGAPGASATGAADDVAGPVSLDAERARRIGVTYATAERRSFTLAVRALGNVIPDETRLSSVSPKIEGWVEHLYVDFTGAPVLRGAPLLDLYSPMLVSAQEELILARRLADESASASERAARTAQELLQAARRRLRYWDVPEEEIARMEASETPARIVTLRAPASGLVLEKNVVVGMRIMPGMDLYRIADLSSVWLEVEVFEKDLSLLRLGQHGVVLFEAYPGEEFDGLVTYVYPTVSVEARTGRVRLEMANPDLRLKPGMYASVELHLASAREALLVPRTAVLQTGERSLVFVRAEGGSLIPRLVRVGLAAGNDLEIVDGLEAGEVVVNSANFLIDAESNLVAALGAMREGGSARTPNGATPPKPSTHQGHGPR